MNFWQIVLVYAILALNVWIYLDAPRRLSHCHCHKLTPGKGHQPGWFERFLLALIPHFDIIKGIGTCTACGKDASNGGTIVDASCTSCGGAMKEGYTTLYLRRFYLFRSRWLGLNFGDVYLHHIVRSDDDPDPHDHPWSFLGFILKGGYRDDQYRWHVPGLTLETDFSVKTDGSGRSYVDRRIIYSAGRREGPFPETVKPLSIIRRPATHIHKVIVPEGKTAWTLIFTTGYGRDWNFITEKGPVMWRKYLGIPEGIDVGE